ncbi:hypothetical protein HYC85_027061 [Camellia sinensis]|uniref:Cytochrome P450 n=1 Tax=Camellia sinensis TaxID=4442 RepID=A0A7J7G5B9_CAMSI|nr:hypothetical protein HYC85_027061 [Camellia sinensis]
MDLFVFTSTLSPTLLYTSLCIVIFTILFLFFTTKSSSKNSTPPPKLPPGKTGWPIIGETLDLLLIGRRGHPEKFLHDRMERHCPDIFRTSLFGDSKMTFFCGPTAHKFLFANENKLVGSFKWAPKGDNVVVIDMAKKFTFELACQLLLNVTDSKQVAKFDNQFRNVIAGMMSVPIDFPGTSFNRAIKDANLIRKELLTLIKERKMAVQQKNKDSIIIRDLLSHLLITPDEDGKLMNDVEIADKIIGQLIAGYDTASTTITFILKYLAEHPHFYDEVFKGNTLILLGKIDVIPLK